jgi:ribosomal 50S subunit-recycling heat shock protein
LCAEGKVRVNCQKVSLTDEVEVKEGDIFDVWLSNDQVKRWIFEGGEWKCFTT